MSTTQIAPASTVLSMPGAERFHVIEDVAVAKGGAFGGPGTGKTMLWALIICGLGRHWKLLDRPIVIFDTEQSSGFLKTIFDYAGFNIQNILVNSEDFSLKRLQEDMDFASKNAAFFLADSIADPWEEVQAAYLAEHRKSKMEIQDWPEVFRRWAYSFEVPFKNMMCHAFWTSKPKGIYERTIDEEKSAKKGRDVYVSTKIDETSVGGRTRSSEFGPGLAVECMNIIEDGKTVREVSVTKDRFITLNGKSFRFEETVTSRGEVDYVKLVDENITFKSFWPHFSRINPKATHRPASLAPGSRSLFVTPDVPNGEFYKEREGLCSEVQDIMVMRFPGATGADKSAKIKLALFVFNTTVWETVQRSLPVDVLRRAVVMMKVIIGNDNILNYIIGKWDGTTQRDQVIMTKLSELTESYITNGPPPEPVVTQTIEPPPQNGAPKEAASPKKPANDKAAKKPAAAPIQVSTEDRNGNDAPQGLEAMKVKFDEFMGSPALKDEQKKYFTWRWDEIVKMENGKKEPAAAKLVKEIGDANAKMENAKQTRRKKADATAPGA